MRVVTAEQMYNEYRRQIFRYKNGFNPKARKNFDEIKKKPDWACFEIFADMVNKNNMNYEYFIEALVHFSKGWFNPSLLGHKGIRLYKEYMLTQRASINKDTAIKGITKSINHIVNFCVENDLKCLAEYLDYNRCVYPTVLADIRQNYVTYEFISLISSFKYLLQLSYPSDCVADACPDLYDRFDKIRKNILRHAEIKKIADNMENLIKKMVAKRYNRLNSDK